MSLNFIDELKFGIPEIDDQHSELFRIYNDFSDSIEAGSGKEAVSLLAVRLNDFAVYHFRFEERLIEKSAYPEAEGHLEEHRQAVDAMKHYKAMIDSGELSRELLLSIKRQLLRLLINHVKNCDLSLCRYLQGVEDYHKAAPVAESPVHAIKKIGEILVDSGSISRHTLEMALEKQKEVGQRLGEVLLGMGAVKAEDIIEAFALQIGLLKSNLEIDKKDYVV